MLRFVHHFCKKKNLRSLFATHRSLIISTKKSLLINLSLIHPRNVLFDHSLLREIIFVWQSRTQMTPTVHYITHFTRIYSRHDISFSHEFVRIVINFIDTTVHPSSDSLGRSTCYVRPFCRVPSSCMSPSFSLRPPLFASPPLRSAFASLLL